MLDGAIEETLIPRNPLDVLAQQIVAICADEEIAVDELHELVRGAYPFADLSRVQLENVLDMLAGPLPVRRVRRAAAARSSGTAPPASSAAAQGARRLAVTNAGTIPDRGLFGVHLVDGGGRVGELDEEMVYEARAGQTFLLGASTWRIEEITRDRVLVSPAPGVPGAVPFWKGEGVGRPYELGEAIGATSRELVALSDDEGARRGCATSTARRARRAQPAHVPRASRQAATGAVPSDRTIVVERFRDEIGDWRVCILTPFGARVHAPWALALAARLRESLGLEVQSIWSDDGIALHLPDADAPPPRRRPAARARRGRGARRRASSAARALFGARFRENAGARAAHPAPPARASARRSGSSGSRRSPCSRSRAATGSFPIVLETYRECLQDVFDLPALKRLLQGLRTRQIDLVDVETAVGVAVRGLAALRLRRDVHVRGRHAAGRAPRAGALARPRPAARAARPGGAARPARPRRARRGRARSCAATPRNADELHDLLRLRGDLRDGRVRRRPRPSRCSARAARRPRARRGRGAPDRGRGRRALPRRARRDAAGRAARRRSSRPATSRSRSLLRRFARGRGPFTTARGGRALRPRRRAGAARSSSATSELVRGELRPGGTEREWCDPDVLRRLRRASLAALRREVEPAEQAALGRFLPAGRASTGARRCARRSCRSRGWRCRSRSGSREVLPRRVPGYQPAQLDQLCASGEVVWVGAGLDRVAIYFREDAPALGPPPRSRAAGGRGRTSGCARLSPGAPSSGSTCSTTTARP